MSEAKRATWREFFEYGVGRLHDEFLCAASLVKSQREAEILWVSICGNRTPDEQRRFYKMLERWTDWIGSNGISPPVDPPNVAEVLESVAVELDGAALASEGQRVKCVVSGPASESASVYWEGEEAAFRDASGRVRAKAKEFT